MRLSWLPYAFFLALPLTTAAQGPEADADARLRALEEQVRALQAEVAALKDAQTAAAAPVVSAPAPSAPAPTPETPSALAAAPTGGEAQQGAPLPVYGGSSSKALNPDVGMIGNFIAAAGPSGTKNETITITPETTNVQKLSMLSFGNAMSRAPIISGMQ